MPEDNESQSRIPVPQHDHGNRSEQDARSEGEHGWGYGGRPEEEINDFVGEDEPQEPPSSDEQR